jgi:ABC-type phosphate transport system substrate-binding protein
MAQEELQVNSEDYSGLLGTHWSAWPEGGPRITLNGSRLIVGVAPVEVRPAQPASAATFVTITGAGSTWAANAINTWAADVGALGLPVNYAAVGSTTGRNDFKNGSVNFAASEIPYGVPDGTNVDPPPARGYAYLPDVAGGLAFMYNLTADLSRPVRQQSARPSP